MKSNTKSSPRSKPSLTKLAFTSHPIDFRQSDFINLCSKGHRVGFGTIKT